jgi:hypothetical protein
MENGVVLNFNYKKDLKINSTKYDYIFNHMKNNFPISHTINNIYSWNNFEYANKNVFWLRLHEFNGSDIPKFFDKTFKKQFLENPNDFSFIVDGSYDEYSNLIPANFFGYLASEFDRPITDTSLFPFDRLIIDKLNIDLEDGLKSSLLNLCQLVEFETDIAPLCAATSYILDIPYQFSIDSALELFCDESKTTNQINYEYYESIFNSLKRETQELEFYLIDKKIKELPSKNIIINSLNYPLFFLNSIKNTKNKKEIETIDELIKNRNVTYDLLQDYQIIRSRTKIGTNHFTNSNKTISLPCEDGPIQKIDCKINSIFNYNEISHDSKLPRYYNIKLTLESNFENKLFLPNYCFYDYFNIIMQQKFVNNFILDDLNLEYTSEIIGNSIKLVYSPSTNFFDYIPKTR